jgi:hypothetical protein
MSSEFDNWLEQLAEAQGSNIPTTEHEPSEEERREKGANPMVQGIVDHLTPFVCLHTNITRPANNVSQRSSCILSLYAMSSNTS